MIRWHTTCALLLVTIGLGAYLSLYELRQPDPEERARRSRQALDIPPETVTRLVVELPQAKVALSRKPKGWTLDPRGFRADGGVVSRILDHLNPITAERILSGSQDRPLDRQAFGLDPAAGQLTVVSHDQATVLLMGETTAVGENRYLQIAGRPEVYVVAASLFTDANRPPEAFRDTHVAGLSAWQVDEVTLTRSDMTYALSRTDDAWRFTAPWSDLADRQGVNAFLNRLDGLRIQRFLDDASAEPLAAAGLEPPTTSIAIRLKGEETAGTTVMLGHPLPQDASLLYAKRSDEPFLYAVTAHDVEALAKDPAEWRAKGCFEFFLSQAEKVELVRQETRWVMVKRDAAWKAEGADAALDVPRVEGFLNTLADLRISRFVEETPPDLPRYGLEPPYGSIAIWVSGREEPQRLLVGAPLEGAATRYGRIDGRSPILELPAIVAELLTATPDQLIAPAASASPAPRAPEDPDPDHPTR